MLVWVDRRLWHQEGVVDVGLGVNRGVLIRDVVLASLVNSGHHVRRSTHTTHMVHQQVCCWPGTSSGSTHSCGQLVSSTSAVNSLLRHQHDLKFTSVVNSVP